MGSRKKKKIIETQKIAFLCWYKGLNINQRIAFKHFAFTEGRRRWTLQELLNPNFYWKSGGVPYSGGQITLLEAVERGFTIRWN